MCGTNIKIEKENKLFVFLFTICDKVRGTIEYNRNVTNSTLNLKPSLN